MPSAAFVASVLSKSRELSVSFVRIPVGVNRSAVNTGWHQSVSAVQRINDHFF
jgi:hypothetical protein